MKGIAGGKISKNAEGIKNRMGDQLGGTFGRFLPRLFLFFGVMFNDLRIDEVDHIFRDIRGVVG